MRTAHSASMLDASEILPGLWQGAFPRNLRAVERANFDVIVLCAFEVQPPDPPGVRFAIWRCPLDDADPTAAECDTAARMALRVAQAVRAGKRVLVTCALGLNRSGLVVALALRVLTGWPGEQVVRHVRARRYAALSNPYFVSLIRSAFPRARDRRAA